MIDELHMRSCCGLLQVDRIIFCVFLKIDHNIYSSLLHYYFPVESPVDSSEEQSSGEELDGIYIAYTPEVYQHSTLLVLLSLQDLHRWKRSLKNLLP